MRKAAIPLLALGVIASNVLAQHDDEAAAKAVVDQAHDYYVKEFNDLALAKEGVFGTARIERSEIKNHRRDGGDPSYRNDKFQSTVWIYGAHGKSLSSGAVTQRYGRSPSSVPSGYQPAKSKASTLNVPKFVEAAVSAWTKRGARPLVKWDQGVRLEARPILLSKKECLNCHKGMKLGQPVAVMVYQLAQLEKLRG